MCQAVSHAMPSPTKPNSPGFDASARIFSILSVLGAAGVLFVRFFPPDRGIDFRTHVLLLLAFFAQVALLLLFSVIALILGIRGRLRLSGFTACLSALAVVGLLGQFYAVRTVMVDGSSVP